MSEKKIKIEVDKGPAGYSLSTFNNKTSGTRVAGPKPGGFSKAVHSFEVDVNRLLKAIESDSYEKEDPQ